MSLDQQTVRAIARLARLAVSDDEARALKGELSAILDWADQLGAVDTDGVEPMSSVIHVEMKKRADEITDGGYRDRILQNAPQRDGPFFLVPKVVE